MLAVVVPKGDTSVALKLAWLIPVIYLWVGSSHTYDGCVLARVPGKYGVQTWFVRWMKHLGLRWE